PDGNVVVAGNSSGSLDGPTAGNIDGFLRLYTNAGILSWSQQLGSDEEDRIEAVTVSHTGDITVAGYTSGSLFIANLGAYDIFLRKFESSGQLLWSRQLGTDEGDFAVAVASLG